MRVLLSRVDVRLLTLTGAPGIGKTRLALATASDQRHEFEHGVVFVDLSSIRDPALVAPAIAEALGVRPTLRRPPLTRLKRFLRDWQVLLVLDNFEQVAAAREQVAELLAATSRVKALVTSRASLRLTWEHEFRVPPLALPAPDQTLEPDAALQFPAIALFVERARAVRSDFTLNRGNVRAVADICIRLEGIPLAIELAAIHAKVFTPQELLAPLGHRLNALTGGAHDLPSRHRTLREAIAWSYGLLSPEEQQTFRRLSVFIGGCTLKAAVALCDDTGAGQAKVLTWLATLADQSLLHRDEPWEGESRLHMLETIREFAEEQLRESPEGTTIRRRHRDWCLGLAEEASRLLLVGSPDQAVWLGRLELEHANLRAALGYSQEAGDAATELRLVTALSGFWLRRGHVDEGRAWLGAALGREPSRRTADRATALGWAGFLALHQGDYATARTLHEEALAIRRELNDTVGIGQALNSLGNVAHRHGDYAMARQLFEEALQIARTRGDKLNMAGPLNNLANVALDEGNLAAARAFHTESISIKRKLRNKIGVANSLNGLAGVAAAEGDLPGARALFEESLKMRRDLGDRQGIAYSLNNLGYLVLQQGDFALTRALLEESAARNHEMGDGWGMAFALDGFAGLAAAQGQSDRAARLFGATDALLESLDAPLPGFRRAAHDRYLTMTRSVLGKRAFKQAWETGREMLPEHAIEYARVAPEALPGGRHSRARGRTGPLTQREMEVASLVARGLSNLEIATALVVTRKTAAAHVEHILNKLGFHSRAQIASWAVSQNIPPTPSR